MTARTLEHLISNVLPAAADYADAERELTVAYNANNAQAEWEAAGRRVKRRAAELAIAIDGLTDRLSGEIGLSKATIRRGTSALCLLPGSGAVRLGA